jgi:hypothetical protein
MQLPAANHISSIFSLTVSISSRPAALTTATTCGCWVQVKPLQAPQQQQQPSSSTSNSNLDAVVAVFKQASLQSKQQDAACTDITNKQPHSSSNSSSCSSISGSKEPLPSRDLAPLLALCPASISQQYLACMLQQSFRGDMQAAADWLLECPDLLARQEAWQEQQQEEQQRRQQEQEERRQTKKQLVER